jgi:hypothetical protein
MPEVISDFSGWELAATATASATSKMVIAVRTPAKLIHRRKSMYVVGGNGIQ